jgi:HSP20 family protein
MLNMTPYSRKHNDVSMYNPFNFFDDMERNFFGSNSIGEFKTDIQDNGKEYVMEADLPGFKKEDIHIDLNDNALTISAQRHSDFEEKDKKGNFIRCERSFGSYQRSFELDGIQVDKIKAAYENGVLKVTLPKAAPAAESTRRLEIE